MNSCKKMNPAKKVYCRIFQKVFKLAIPLLPYRNPEILHSTGAVPEYLAKKGKKTILVVTDKALHGMGHLEPLKKALEKNGITYFVYDDTVPNPTVRNVEEAKALYLEKNCGCIVGFGGGSSIDCAKAVGARIARPDKPVNKMEGILKILKKTPLFIAVPTTAGTGSEVTVATVISDHETGHKFPISDFCLIPDAAVLDAEITLSLPKSLTSTTGMDALTHAIEAYIGNSAVKASKKDALDALKLISENLEKAYENGSDLAARKNMLYAAFLAGRAFSKSYVGYCHAVAHSLGGKYNTPHGLANAVILPYVLECYGEKIYGKAKNIAIAMGIADEITDEKSAYERLISKIREMNKNMGIPEKIAGIREEDIPKLAAYAAKEANPLYPVPVLYSREQLEKIYYMIKE